MKKSSVVLIVIVALVLAVGAFALTRKSSKPAPATTTGASSQTVTQSAGTSPSSEQSSAATITYSDNGFSPAKLTVQSGSTVTIKNTSSQPMQLDSNPHPVHTDDTDLNVGLVEPGQSKTFTVHKTGTFGYHNHLNPSDTGTIVIQ